MAKKGNKSGVKHIDMVGRCVDCGKTGVQMFTVKRSTIKKSWFVKVCEECKV
jgi:hypothetical protein